MLAMVSDLSTGRFIVVPVRVFMNICFEPPRHESLRRRVRWKIAPYYLLVWYMML